MAKKKSPEKKAHLPQSKPTAPPAKQSPATAGTGQSGATANHGPVATAIAKEIWGAIQGTDDANAAAFDARVKKVTDQENAKARTGHKLERAPDKGAELSEKEKRDLRKKELEADRVKRREEAERANKVPLLYYERPTRKFWLKDGAVFDAPKEEHIKLDLIDAGVSEHQVINGMYEIDRHFFIARKERAVDYAGSLPGWRVMAEPQQMKDKRVLITTQAAEDVWAPFPNELEPDPPFFFEAIQEILDHQYLHFCWWLAVGLRSLRRGDFKPGQLSVLIGKANSGKNLIQEFITHVFGGRAMKCQAAMGLGVGNGDKFNGNLNEAEHWFMGDPVGSQKMEHREQFGGLIKEFFHEEEFVFRVMQKMGFKARCFRRGSISINHRDEDLRVLPPMRDGLKDKINLYWCGDVTDDDAPSKPLECLRRFTDTTLPLPGHESKDGADRQAIYSAITKEAPAIRRWLLTKFKDIPADWTDQRCGVRCYHHPLAMRKLGDMSNESRVLAELDSLLFERKPATIYPADWGTPESDNYREELSAAKNRWKNDQPVEIPFVIVTDSELKDKIHGSARHAEQLKYEVRNLGRWFSQIRHAYPERISKATTPTNAEGVIGGIQLWKITNPFKAQKQTEET